MNGKMVFARILLSGASLAALTAQAYAQDQSAVSDEIVVTATGRQAALQDVPLAVTAVSGETMLNAGVTDLRDLQQLAPSYRFFTGQSNSAGTTAYIRGIGTGGDNPGFESAVGFFIDGVYRNRSGVALSELPQVERVEVLRGPQGTLFGRNTSAGAISVVTAGPDFTTSAWMEASGGERKFLSGSAGMNLPLAEDVLAVRIDGNIQHRDGYITDIVSGRDINDRNRWSARGQALWDIAPNASLRLIVDGAEMDEECCTAVAIVAGPTAFAINAIAPGGYVIPPDPEARRMAITPGRSYGEKIDEWGVSGQLDWDWGFADFTSVSAYRDWQAVRNQDIDFAAHDRAYRDGYEVGFQTFTQEFRLHGDAGMLDWLVGVFYADEELPLTDTIRVGTQAAQYVDALARGQDLSGLGVPVPTEIYRSIDPASPLFLQVAFGALAATLNPATPNFATVAGNLAAGAGPGGLAEDLALADPLAGHGQQADRWRTDTQSLAIFTHNEISLSDQLTLTLGARFNHEQKDLTANLSSIFPSCGAIQTNAASAAAVLSYTPNPALPVANQQALGALATGVLQFLTLACNPAINTIANGSFSDSREENEWSGVVSLAYEITPDLMIYGSYSRGYKAGGFNLDRSGFNIVPFSVTTPSTSDLAFDPEFVDAYELGWKWSPLHGAAINAAIFYEQIHDYQENAFSGFNFITFNVPEVVSRGAELDFLFRMGDNFTWQGGIVYTDAFFDSAVSVVGETLPAGTPLPQAPEWSVTSAVTWDQPISDNLRLLGYVDGRWNSEYRVQTLSRNPITDNDSYAIFNARLGIGGADGRWAVQAFVRNLTDEFYHVGGFSQPEQTGSFAVYPNEPRTWGVTLRARY